MVIQHYVQMLEIKNDLVFKHDTVTHYVFSSSLSHCSDFRCFLFLQGLEKFSLFLLMHHFNTFLNLLKNINTNK